MPRFTSAAFTTAARCSLERLVVAVVADVVGVALDADADLRVCLRAPGAIWSSSGSLFLSISAEPVRNCTLPKMMILPSSIFTNVLSGSRRRAASPASSGHSSSPSGMPSSSLSGSGQPSSSSKPSSSSASFGQSSSLSRMPSPSLSRKPSRRGEPRRSGPGEDAEVGLADAVGQAERRAAVQVQLSVREVEPASTSSGKVGAARRRCRRACRRTARRAAQRCRAEPNAPRAEGQLVAPRRVSGCSDRHR